MSKKISLGVTRFHMKNLILIFVCFTLTACIKGEWDVDKIENELETAPYYPKPYPVSSTIVFNNNAKLTTNIIEIEVIDVIISDEGIPFVIFSGVDCYDCHFNRAIYIHSPNAGFLDGKAGKNAYYAPGRLFYYIDNSLIRESRMFYGQCMSETQKNVVWYSKYLGDDNKWHNYVYVVEFAGSSRRIIKNTVKLQYTLIDKTLSLVKAGKCKEVLGDDKTSEP